MNTLGDDSILSAEKINTLDDDRLLREYGKISLSDEVEEGTKCEYALTDEVRRLNFKEACKQLHELLADIALPTFVFPNSSDRRIVRQVNMLSKDQGMRKLTKPNKTLLTSMVEHLIMKLKKMGRN